MQRMIAIAFMSGINEAAQDSKRRVRGYARIMLWHLLCSIQIQWDSATVARAVFALIMEISVIF
jgi:hypothetical protein